MQAGELHFLRFLEGSDKRFIIPVYQRNYDWKREHCEQLFNDLLDLIRNKSEAYFIGSIVSIYDDTAAKNGEHIIIDGQQRITSVTLLMLAMRNLLLDNKLVSKKNNLHELITETYLVDKYAEEEKRIRLKPIKNDNAAFLKLFKNNEEEYIPSSNITSNYQLFEKKLLEANGMGISADEVYDGLKKLMIVDIRLSRGHDNPQLIFESLNSTGKELDQADLVRNYILMDKGLDIQTQYYEDYWHPIELNTKFNVADFLRHYITFEEGKTPRKDDVYKSFKSYVTERCKSENELTKHQNDEKFVELLKRLKKFSLYYKHFIDFDTKSEKINTELKRIDRLQVTVAYPFLMDVFEMQGENYLTNEDVFQVLNTLESFVFRRHICKQATNALNKIFASIGKNIRKVPSHKEDYVEIFKYLITTKDKFPNDSDFLEALTSRDLYKQKTHHRIHLFERLENHNNRERVDVVNLLEAKKEGLSFEHIMPQGLSSKWTSALGENAADIHEKYLHTLGNLTLTAYNSSLGNKLFLEKLSQPNGLGMSKLFLNESLKGLSHWGEEEIVARANLLANKATGIWKYPQSTYLPEVTALEEMSLSDENDITGKKPSEFRFLGDSHKANSWRDIYIAVNKTLFELEAVQYYELLRRDGSDAYMSTEKSLLRDPYKLSDRVFLELNLSAMGIINSLSRSIKHFGLDDSDFVFTLK